MASRYLMQIVERTTGEVVASYEPGLQVERDFITDCIDRTVRLGVGLGRTSAHVEQDMRQGYEDAVMALKQKVQP